MDNEKYKRRFMSRLVPNGSCLEWPGHVDRDGYGRCYKKNGERRSNRIAWTLFHGPIQEGQWVLHRCDNPRCCNPDHLFLGDVSANAKDCVTKGRRPRGSRHHQAKLTEAIVQRLADEHASGASTRKLAEKYSVNQRAIWSAIRGHTWAHISRAR